MTDHEKAALIEAIESARNGKDDRDAWGTWHDMIATVVWQAARKYEPPAVCGDRGTGGALRCVLHTGHDGDHRTESNRFGTYIGWPREQGPAKRRCSECANLDSIGGHGRGCSKFVEPDPDERCAYIMQDEPFTGQPCNGSRKMHGSGHAFVSARDATK